MARRDAEDHTIHWQNKRISAMSLLRAECCEWRSTLDQAFKQRAFERFDEKG